LLIAHLPSGYLLGALVQKISNTKDRSIVIAAMAGGMIPDADMFYFHLVDMRRTHHHDYLTHWPLFWLAIAMALALVCVFTRQLKPILALAFSAGTFFHMVLDTIAAPVRWLMPFDPRSFELINIPATLSNWIVSFMLHWTFAVEITTCLAAIGLFYRRSLSQRRISRK
jgi:inner membrane protein